MSVSELAEILQDPERLSQVQLVDVREEVEERVASVPEFRLKPLSRCISFLVFDVEFSTALSMHVYPDICKRRSIKRCTHQRRLQYEVEPCLVVTCS